MDDKKRNENFKKNADLFLDEMDERIRLACKYCADSGDCKDCFVRETFQLIVDAMDDKL